VNLRVNSADKKRLLQAAKLAGGNLTGFILSSSLTAADLLLASRTQFSIPEDKWIKFNEMLDAPPRDLPELFLNSNASLPSPRSSPLDDSPAS
jgi:uncharacterized protein (DUF1778 family)